MFVTAAVFQPEMSALNAAACSNMSLRVGRQERTGQGDTLRPRGSSNSEEQDAGKHRRYRSADR
eukprot:2919040-Rhodomonas_salina.1